MIVPSLNVPVTATHTTVRDRIASVDIYRGMVMFLMLAEMLHLYGLKDVFQGEGWLAQGAQWLAFHTTHVPWRGGSLHDMIQPSFTFLVGTAMAFSIASRNSRGQSWDAMFFHAVMRSLVLIFLGIFLRSLGKPATNFTFDDTLTQIGLGYWILFLLSGLRTPKLIVAIGVILLGYWFAFVIYPSPGKYFPYSQYGVAATWTEHYEGIASHFNKNSNLAWAMDRWWMNLFPRNKVYQFSSGGYCTLSFIPTLGTMLLGLLAGRILQGNSSKPAKQIWLWISAALCAGIAVAIDAQGLCPIVKRIWTPTWVLWSGGLCFAWLAVLNLVCDIGGFKRWGSFFLVIGANSIVAYVMSWTLKEPIRLAIERHFGFLVTRLDEFVGWIVKPLVQSEETPSFRPMLLGALTLALMWIVLLWMHRRKIFVKI
jgi:heparan-alpha-glucosaminide N-acetyltransferase